MKLVSLLVVLLLPLFSHAKNDVIFEGYYRLLASNVPVGYVITRYEYNSKKKQFLTKSYIRGNSKIGNLQESLVAISDNQFKPVSYQYTSKMNKAAKSIDAKFKKTKAGFNMTASIFNAGTRSSVTKQIPKGVFLSSFQVLVMLQNGLTPGKKYTFNAISEEDAEISAGESYIKEQTGFEGKGILRILNQFKGSKYVSNVTKDGEVLITESPLQKIQTQLVAMPADATKGFPYDISSLKLIFGDIPRGQKNVLARNRLAAQAPKKVVETPQAPEGKVK